MKVLLFILLPGAAALGMMAWLIHARGQGGHRWILHWLATLVPAGLLLAILPVVPYAQVPDALFILALAGTAAFAGGGLYLVVSALAASESVRALGVSMVESFRESHADSWTEDDYYDYHNKRRYWDEEHTWTFWGANKD